MSPPQNVIPSGDDGGMEMNPAVVQAEEAVDASVAGFMAALRGQDAAGARPDTPGAKSCSDDLLQRVADAALDVLAVVARSEAKIAAVKVLAAAVLAEATRALNSPPASAHEASAQDGSLVTEVGCALPALQNQTPGLGTTALARTAGTGPARTRINGERANE
jgi:hypothetical protein